MTTRPTGMAGLMSRTLSYAMALVSLTISLLLYLEFIGDKLSGARIPQDIDTPCALFFLALAIIFAALGLAEKPELLPPQMALDPPDPLEPQEPPDV